MVAGSNLATAEEILQDTMELDSSARLTCCAQTSSWFPATDAGGVIHVHPTASPLPATVRPSAIYLSARTTKAANDQEGPQMSGAARQLSQQEAAPSLRLSSATRGAPIPPRPNRTKECLAFPAAACVEAMKPGQQRERSWSKERSDAKKKKRKKKSGVLNSLIPSR